MALEAQVVAAVWAKSRIGPVKKRISPYWFHRGRLLGLLGQTEWCADRLGSSAGPEILWGCAGQLLFAACPGPSWLFLTPGLREIWKGWGISRSWDCSPVLVIRLPSCLSSCSRIAGLSPKGACEASWLSCLLLLLKHHCIPRLVFYKHFIYKVYPVW